MGSTSGRGLGSARCVGLAAWIGACGSGAGPLSDGPAQAIDGRVTWRVTWDASGRAAGQEDCRYVRAYTGLEDRSQPWLCPDCDVVFRVDTVVVEGRSCHGTISETPPSPVEWLGTGGDTWYRSSTENLILTEQGVVAREEQRLLQSSETDWIDHPDGRYQLTISGDLELIRGEGDPWHGFRPPRRYACGWSRADPAAYDGSYLLRAGRDLPDGWFLDACDEGVRLHDFAARYLVVDIAATDCGPCRDMARDAPEALAVLDGAGLQTEAVTLLAPSLTASIAPTPTGTLDAWADTFGLDSPVLGDRGWGAFVVGEALGQDFAYPTVVVVAPDLEVLDVQVGYGGWDRIEAVIRAHRGS